MYGDLFGGNAMSSEALCRSLALSRLVRGEEDVAAHVLEERCMDRCDSKVGAESQGYVVPLQCAGLVAGLKRCQPKCGHCLQEPYPQVSRRGSSHPDK